MLKRIRKTGYVYWRSRRSIWAYLKRTRDFKLLFHDAGFMVFGPRWDRWWTGV